MTPERFFQLRAASGINRMENQRIDEEPTWFTTLNMYARTPDFLATRPGSKLIVQGAASTVISLPSVSPLITGSQLGNGETLNPLVTAVQLNIADIVNQTAASAGLATGINTTRPTVVTATKLAKSLHFVGDPILADQPSRVGGLFRAYLDGGSKRYWVGAYNFQSDKQDRLFYIKSDLSGTQIINDSPGLISSHGADFVFMPWRNQVVNDPAHSTGNVQNYFAIGVNGINQPFVLKDGSTYGDVVEVAGLECCRAGGFNADGSGSPGSGYERLTHVRTLTSYVGSVVYGGFHTIKPSDGTDTNWENYIVFADPNRPHSISDNGGVMGTIRIGDSSQEPVTALANTTTTLSVAGVRGQLVAFTPRRVTVFDGVPPSTGNPLGSAFSSTTSQTVGCNAPRTVAVTPLGVIFLGSDGYVYIIPNYASTGPIRIGHKVWDFTRQLTTRQQNACSGYWNPLGYYCLSFPGSAQSATMVNKRKLAQVHGPGRNVAADTQLWADFRQYGQGVDQGVRWYGPMFGMVHSVYARADGPEDNYEIYAGSALDGAVMQVWRDDLANDPVPSNPTATQNINCYAVTGEFDAGDLHLMKWLGSTHFQVGADFATPFTIKLVGLNADTAGSETAETFTETAQPSAAQQLGSNFILGTSTLTEPDSSNPFAERPSDRILCRAFRVEFQVPGNGARVTLSDVDIGYFPQVRRQ